MTTHLELETSFPFSKIIATNKLNCFILESYIFGPQVKLPFELVDDSTIFEGSDLYNVLSKRVMFEYLHFVEGQERPRILNGQQKCWEYDKEYWHFDSNRAVTLYNDLVLFQKNRTSDYMMLQYSGKEWVWALLHNVTSSKEIQTKAFISFYLSNDTLTVQRIQKRIEVADPVFFSNNF